MLRFAAAASLILLLVLALRASPWAVAQPQDPPPAPTKPMLDLLIPRDTSPTPQREVRIGVLAYRGADEAIARWQPTADYLHQQVPRRRFVIVPLGFIQMSEAAARGEIDFFATNPAKYVELEHRHGATRIATLRTIHNNVAISQFGGVIFTRARRNDLTTIADLRGQRFMAYDEESFGGWWMAWREIKDHGIDPYRQFRELRFAGTSQDDVVFAVRDGIVDAGTVRTGQLERMAAEGLINIDDFKVLSPKTARKFPLRLSTRLYPEWPIAVMPHVREDLARDVTVALLRMQRDDAAAVAGGFADWTIPLDYTPVHDLLRELRRGPYSDFSITHAEAARLYRYWILGALLALMVLSLTTFGVLGMNRSLQRMRRSLETELASRRRMEEALRANEERTRLIIETAQDAFIAMDTNGAIISWNARAEAMFGWRRDEILGKELGDTVTPPTLRRMLSRALQMYHQTGQPTEMHTRIQLTALHRSGREFPVELAITPIRFGESWFFAAFVHDITERKVAERQLREKNQQLEAAARAEREAYEQLKRAQSGLVQSEKLAALGQMVAGVAHEINNPLAFVGNNTAVLQRDLIAVRDTLSLYRRGDAVLQKNDPELYSQIRETVERVDLDYTITNLQDLLLRSREGLRRIQQIVGDLRDFARLDDRDLHEADLNAGIESTVNIVRGQAKKKQVRVETHLAPLPPVRCFPAKINQVVMNLLVNAIDACDDGGSISVTTEAVASNVRITVEDSGRGIDPEIRGRIFDPFFTTKPTGQGTGLGLSISYGIVRDHHGDITVESEPGKGSKFIVTLPIHGVTERKDDG